MRKYWFATTAALIALAAAGGVLVTTNPSSGGEYGPDNPPIGCLETGSCVDISSIPDLCPEGRDEKGRPGCLLILEGEELQWNAAERARFVDWMREQAKRDREDEAAGIPPVNDTGCPAVIDDPKNPPPGCTPPELGWPGGKPPTPHPPRVKPTPLSR